MRYDEVWLEATKETLNGYRRMIEAAAEQLSDEQFFARPQPGMNSVATLLRHLGGNLQSRWTSFLTEDGEKASRDRELEFADWTGSRESLVEYFDAGWKCLVDAIEALRPEDIQQTVKIRGEPHSVPEAIMRSLTHISYHVGQLLLVARQVHGDADSWQWLTIQPGGSQKHNRDTWGTAASRGAAGRK